MAARHVTPQHTAAPITGKHLVTVPASITEVIHICRPTGTENALKQPKQVISLAQRGVTTCPDCGATWRRGR